MLNKYAIGKRNLFKYLLITFIVFSIIGLFLSFYFRNSNPKLKDGVLEVLAREHYNPRIDSSIVKLYCAENDWRSFILQKDKSYYKHFVDDLNAVLKEVDSLGHEHSDSTYLDPASIQSLIGLKKLRSKQFLNLKKNTDSLLDKTILKGDYEALFAMERKLAQQKPAPPKMTSYTDTVYFIGNKQTTKKGVLGRIADAISNKSNQVGVDTSLKMLVHTREVLDTVVVNKSSMLKQNRNVEANIKDYLNYLNRAKVAERELLAVNHQLITKLIDLLNDYKRQEINYTTKVRQLTASNISSRMALSDSYTYLGSIFLILLLFLLFYTLNYVYRNELSLIRYGRELKAYAERKSNFLANMSHEIRTPLNSILGFSEQLEEAANLPHKEKKHVEAIRNASHILLDVVNDILDYSKYENNLMVFNELPFPLKKTIDEVSENLKILAEQKDLNYIYINHIAQNKYVMGDALRLKQLLINILSNAIKFTHQGFVKLEVHSITKDAQRWIQIMVSDTGIGIKEEDQKFLFDDYYQINPGSIDEKDKGTGLGLAISKKIVEALKGFITLKSTYGQGTEITILLPLKVSYKQLIRSNQTEHQYERLKDIKILLVDDYMMNILLVSTILKKWGIHYDSVTNGQDALTLFEKNTYDIVLTDIQMPVMDGIALTHKIRKFTDPKKAEIPVLGVTANVLPEDQERYLEIGINDLILKPFREQEFLDKIYVNCFKS